MSIDFGLYKWVVLGIVFSVVLPVLRPLLLKPGEPGRLAKLRGGFTPYAATGLFSAIVAVLLMAYLQDQITSWSSALLAGYACDSTLQKMSTGNSTV